MKFFASFVMFSLLLNVFATAQTLIQDSCKKAAAGDPNIKYDLCVKTLEENPESKDATNLVGLLTTSTKIAASKMVSMKGIVVNLLKSKKYPDMEKPLPDCLELYYDGNNDLKEALKSIYSHDYSSANVNLSDALTSSTTCETGFKEVKQQSPLTNDKNVLFEKIVIHLALIRNMGLTHSEKLAH